MLINKMHAVILLLLLSHLNRAESEVRVKKETLRYGSDDKAFGNPKLEWFESIKNKETIDGPKLLSTDDDPKLDGDGVTSVFKRRVAVKGNYITHTYEWPILHTYLGKRLTIQSNGGGSVPGRATEIESNIARPVMHRTDLPKRYEWPILHILFGKRSFEPQTDQKSYYAPEHRGGTGGTPGNCMNCGESHQHEGSPLNAKDTNLVQKAIENLVKNSILNDLQGMDLKTDWATMKSKGKSDWSSYKSDTYTLTKPSTDTSSKDHQTSQRSLPNGQAKKQEYMVERTYSFDHDPSPHNSRGNSRENRHMLNGHFLTKTDDQSDRAWSAMKELHQHLIQPELRHDDGRVLQGGSPLEISRDATQSEILKGDSTQDNYNPGAFFNVSLVREEKGSDVQKRHLADKYKQTTRQNMLEFFLNGRVRSQHFADTSYPTYKKSYPSTIRSPLLFKLLRYKGKLEGIPGFFLRGPPIKGMIPTPDKPKPSSSAPKHLIKMDRDNQMQPLLHLIGGLGKRITSF